MLFKIFTLHPDIFESFTKNALIARGVAKNVIKFELINWRTKYGIGNYKQVDDSPFGGGTGMVLMAEPIVKAIEENLCFKTEKEEVNKNRHTQLVQRSHKTQTEIANEIICDNFSEQSEESATIDDITSNEINNDCLSEFDSKLSSTKNKHLTIKIPSQAEDDEITVAHLNPKTSEQHPIEHKSYLPNNAKFYQDTKSGKNKTKKVNIMMTPRGFPMNQKVVEWLAEDFEEINILCGRYEGFDERVKDYVDLELSIGNFVLNGGEVGAMCLVEAVSRLVPDFITKNNSVLHDSFSSGLNEYKEFQFENSKHQYRNEIVKSVKTPLAKGSKSKTLGVITQNANLFDNEWWTKNILPHIEHPQYTRPEVWRGISVPAILKTGDHAKIQKWRTRWY